ncbi:PJA2 ligase, partial [Calyptomena viridis]|nr:PJA2 ligase [Calyptomena viridis]
MGQGVGKTAWHKPAGAYQTTTGRRFGRRHAYVGFRSLLNSQDRDAHQDNEDCKQSEMEDVEENSLCIPLVQVSAALLDEPLSENSGNREPICRSVSSQTSEAKTPPISVSCCGPEGNKISQNFMNPYENSEEFAEYTGHDDLNGKNGIAFVNIDSYEPDSSDGEEDDAQDKYSWVREAASIIQGKLDNIFSQWEKELESLNHSVSRESCEEAGPMHLACPNSRIFKSTEDQAIPKSSVSDTSYEKQQIRHTVGGGNGTPVPIADVLNINDGKTDRENSSEPVVRPKIRKQDTANQLEREKHLPRDDEKESGSWRRIGLADVQQCHPDYTLRDSREMTSSVFIFSRLHSGPKNTERDLRKNAVAQNQKNILDDSTFWDEFGDYNRHCLMSHKDEDSSECSDGEWATAVPTYFTASEKEQSSSDESWETVPSREEHDPEVQSSSPGVKEEKTDFCFPEGYMTLLADFLEEGEIHWLQYREEVESSSDEEDDPITDFMHPGFFLFDGNNNLEDDSSVSEDLDVEWRLLDEFGDGLGLAQNIPYVEPQLLTFMGRLEAAETALAQLESLAFDVEQTHPPATKETIDCLPLIVVTGDYNDAEKLWKSQEQCCAICCSECVRGEIITELPCHHLFHKSCVTLWLQRSGTCPVCRHVLAPVLPEAADDTDISL